MQKVQPISSAAAKVVSSYGRKGIFFRMLLTKPIQASQASGPQAEGTGGIGGDSQLLHVPVIELAELACRIPNMEQCL